jgi:drug/metabolite transporter (DMT)-like permease
MKSIISSTTLLAILACLLWSTAFAGVKIGLEYTTPLRFAGLRFLVASLLLFPLVLKYKDYFTIIRRNLKVFLMVAFLNTLLQYSLFYLGMSLVPAALGAILIGSSPLFVAGIAHFVLPNEKLTRARLAIFLLGILGIILVTLGRNRFTIEEEVGLLGVFLLLLVNTSSGLGNVIVSRDAKGIPPLVLSSASMLIGGTALFLISLPFEKMIPGVRPPVYYISLFWLGFLSAAAISIWFFLLKRPEVRVSDLNFWKFIIPVVGAILAWLFVPGEKPSWIAFAGMVIIAVALAMLHIQKKRLQNKLSKP